MNARRAIIVGTMLLSLTPVARSGHELPVYPSYYPHEIELATVAPERAAELLRNGKMHAYLERGLQIAGAPPDALGSVETLGSFIVVRLNPDSPFAKEQASACAAVATMLRDMEQVGGEVIVHPYPVTPYHGDYLYHSDLADAARAHFFGTAREAGSVPQGLQVKAEGAAALSVVRPERLAKGDRWDAAIAEVDAGRLVSEATVAINGWLGPRWVRSGWFHAYRLLFDAVADPTAKSQVTDGIERLRHARYDNQVERINLERDLVKALSGGCRTVVAGYTLKRQYFNAEFSAGVENIAYDALEGFSSPMFLRTVKLKDFPWNGWLQLGIAARPEAAWNPIAGFNDEFGRLLWFAVADPAVLPSPYDANWMLNRFSDVQSTPRR
jgi:hypothetical protein